MELVLSMERYGLPAGYGSRTVSLDICDLLNEVVDLDSRSVLPSGPWGLVVRFRRRGLVR